jgi:WD40 repeat protein/predicted Ser/Thr protein kinase
MNPSQGHTDTGLDSLLGQVLDEFTDRLNRGEQPDLEAYVRKHPQLESVLRQVYSVLQLARSPRDTPSLSPPATGPTSPPDHLGDFRLLREVGRGGMGVVYEAVQESLGRHVALKVLPVQAALSPVYLERFQREAQAAARLHHTNIVPVFGVGEHDGVHYYAMQFIAGRSLAEVIAERQKPGFSPEPGSWKDAARIGAQLADALVYAHGQGVLHRDIKPANLLLDTQGSAWITDFGLAKIEDQDGLTQSGDFLGTLRYLAPERLRGVSDARGDLYGLGLTLYELLTRRPAFDGADRDVLVRQITQEEPLRPRQLDPSIPRDLETVVLKAIAKEPERRYQTAAELAEDLRRFLADRPIQARRVTVAEQLWRWCRRNPAKAGLAVAVMGLSLLLLVTALIGYLQTAAALGREAKQRQAAEEQRDRANQRLYLAQLQLARQAWEAGEIPRLEELLAGQCPAAGQPDLRGWEWYYLHALTRPELFRLPGHKGSVTSLDWSPDGRWLATGSTDATVRMWDLERQQERFVLPGHTSHVRRVAWRGDGRQLASSGRDGLIKVWDADTGREVRSWQGHKGGAHWVAWDPADQRLASAGEDRFVKVWDATTGEVTSAFPGHGDAVNVVVWDPDGRRLASAGNDQTVRVWDLATGREVLTLHGYSRESLGLAWRSQAPHLAFARTDRTIRLWDLDKGREDSVLAGHRERAGWLAWRRDGQLLSSGGDDNTIRIWDPKRASEVLTLRTPTRRHAWSPDGTRLATGGEDGFVRVWDVTREPASRVLRGPEDRILAVAWSPNGRQVASAGRAGSVLIWDPGTGQRLVTFPAQAGPVQALVWSPDGEYLATAGADKTVRLLSVPRQQEVCTLGSHDGPARAVAWSPDGQRLASAGEDKTIRLWDVAARRELRTLGGPGGIVRCLAWSPDGRWLASADDAQGQGALVPQPQKGWDVRAAVRLRVWDAATGEEVFASDGHALRIDALAWARDSRRLATASWDQTVKLWDVAERQEVGTLRGHTYFVHAVAWSPDGRRLASAGADRAVRVWDLTTGQEILTLRGHTYFVSALAWSPDGWQLASGSWDGTVRIWDASRGHELEQGAGGLPPLK